MRSMVEGAFGIEVNRHGRRPFHRSFAGQEKQIRSRGAFRARGLLDSLPQKRGAERRKAQPSIVRAAPNRCLRLPMPGRGSALFRGALAFRRSTAALATPDASSIGSAPDPRFLRPG